MDGPRSSEPRPESSRSRWLVRLLVVLAVGALAVYLVDWWNPGGLTPAQQRELATQAAAWVRAQREVQRPLAAPLAPVELEVLGRYFPAPVLEEARVLGVAEMPEPRFAGTIRYRGRKIFQYSDVRGLTLGDTILLRGANVPAGSPARRSVLFHELVHSLQYRAVGVESFFEHYVASLVATEYRYPAIVFEAQAFELQHRFMVDRRHFSVGDEVDRLVAGLKPMQAPSSPPRADAHPARATPPRAHALGYVEPPSGLRIRRYDPSQGSHPSQGHPTQGSRPGLC